jgi:DNA-binding LytR/AlgR family response regulator
MATGNATASLKQAIRALEPQPSGVKFEDWHDRLRKRPQVVHAEKRREPINRMAGPSSRMPVKVGDRVVLLPLQEILWVQSKGDWICLHAQTADYDCRMTMMEIQKKLPNSFLRVHRNAIVNLMQVSEFTLPQAGNAFVSLSNGKALPISRSGRSELRQYLLSCPYFE